MRKIKKVAVLGAGTMGSQIAAHIANAGFNVLLLDLNRDVAAEGLKRALKAKPAAFMDPDFKFHIEIGGFDTDMEKIREADWIIEAVIEKLDVKRDLFGKVEQHMREDAIVSTNTSGIPIHLILEGRSDTFKKNFLGTHFFNPPRYMKLLEIIPSQYTDREVIDTIVRFAEDYLGKGIVYAKDTPNFIANRIGVFSLMYALRVAQELGLTPEEIDAITGKLIGRPKTATFRLADLVGIDIIAHVANNIYELAKDDEFRDFFQIPDFLQKMIDNKLLGDKTGGGFYKKVEGKRLVLDLETFEYREPKKAQFPELAAIENEQDLNKRLQMIFKAEGKGAEFLKRTLTATLIYSANRIPEIADTIYDVDNAMKWGFAWKLGPFETFDVIGIDTVMEHAEKYDLLKKNPEIVQKLKGKGYERFYRDTRHYFDYYDEDYKEIPRRKEIIIIDEIRDKTIHRNAEASVIDMGDGVLLLEFHSKGNALGFGTLQMLNYAMDLMENDDKYIGMVIGNNADRTFSAGANLGLMAMAIGEMAWDEVERAIDTFHRTFMRMKYFPKPIVSAPFGITVGGGTELIMHTARRVAHAELYTGLVEVGVGLIPGAGGSKEFTIRALKRIPETAENPDPVPIWAEFFKNIAMAKVSTSAYEAYKMGILTDGDIIVMNRDFQLHYAKNLVIGLANAGYTPPHGPERVRVLGWDGYSVVLAQLVNLLRGKFISEYDHFILTQLAKVMTGGPDVAPGTLVDEWTILQWEKEAFLTLIKQPKTHERIFHMLKYRKPLRN